LKVMKCGDALFQEMGIDSEGIQKNNNNNNMNKNKSLQSGEYHYEFIITGIHASCPTKNPF